MYFNMAEAATIPSALPPPHGPAYPALNLPETRLEAQPDDPPSAPPPYSPLLKDIRTQSYIFEYVDEIRQNAMHPVKIGAGIPLPPNGALGRHALPRPPEMLGGALYSCSI